MNRASHQPRPEPVELSRFTTENMELMRVSVVRRLVWSCTANDHWWAPASYWAFAQWQGPSTSGKPSPVLVIDLVSAAARKRILERMRKRYAGRTKAKK